MNREGFRQWMENTGSNKKLASDNLSRAKRMENELGIDLDEEYERDKCQHLLDCFQKYGENDDMKAYNTKLPIGRSSMATYLHTLRKYVAYKRQ